LEPLDVLFEERPAGHVLPAGLQRLYGGGLSIADDLVYANLIASLDGVAAFEATRGAGPTLRGGCDADRFVMGLLRAMAGAIVIGAGTLRTDRHHLWTPGYVAREFGPLYRDLGHADPRLVVVTASGALDPEERALEAGALVITTDAGARRLGTRLPATNRVQSLGSGPLEARAILDAIRAEGSRRVLTEGGPRLLATFVGGGVLDELFLTLSPVLAGRDSGESRLGLIEGITLLPEAGRWARLRSLRRSGSHLFLRYSLKRSGAE
jgi:riboflavin biosynthesis pyrimidine reductase